MSSKELFPVSRQRLKVGGLIILAVVMLGCNPQDQTVFEQYHNRPQPSADYLVYFGPPPVVNNPHVEALVGYLPILGDHRHLAPFPLFMSASSNHFQHLVQRLIDFDSEMAHTMGLQNPFPPGTKILSLRRFQSEIVLDLSFHARHQNNPLLFKAMLSSLIHALTQFHGVKTVTISIEGQVAAQGNNSSEQVEVIGPGPPRLLGVANSPIDRKPVWTFFFDRPVTVQNLQLLNEEGAPIRGTSSYRLYDMAFELRPELSSNLHDGERIRVSWQALDALNSSGSGEATIFLR